MKRLFALASVLAVGAIASTLRTGTAAPAPSSADLDDATIIAIYDGANTSDIETGELAIKKGSTKEIRDFGAMLARDHKSVRQLGRDLAKKLSVTPTPPKPNDFAASHTAAMKKLNDVSGPEFDRAFLQHEVGFHEAVIGAVEKSLLPSAKNAELRGLIIKVAPAFGAHRDAAKSMLSKL